MKKLICLTLSLWAILACIFTFTACQNLPPNSLSFHAQYSRTGFREDLHNPSVTVLHTHGELEAYLATFPYPDASWDNAPTLTQLCERYDEAYFAERDLILVLLEEGSGSVRHKVKKVSRDGTSGQWTIDIERIIPEIGTDDIAGWHIFIEPPKNMRVQDGDTFQIGEHTLTPLPLDTFGYDLGGVQYVRTNGGKPGMDMPTHVVIHSRQELQNYYEQNREYFSFDQSWDESPAFREAIGCYDDAYFIDRDLLVVVLEETSGSYRHKVNFMRTTGADRYEISLSSVIRKNANASCDMAQWHILIELPEGMRETSEQDFILLLSKQYR